MFLRKIVLALTFVLGFSAAAGASSPAIPATPLEQALVSADYAGYRGHRWRGRGHHYGWYRHRPRYGYYRPRYYRTYGYHRPRVYRRYRPAYYGYGYRPVRPRFYIGF